MEEIFVVALVVACIFWALRQHQNTQKVYYIRAVINDKNPKDLYADPPKRGSIIVSSEPDKLVQKINHYLGIKDNHNVFIEHIQPL